MVGKDEFEQLENIKKRDFKNYTPQAFALLLVRFFRAYWFEKANIREYLCNYYIIAWSNSF